MMSNGAAFSGAGGGGVGIGAASSASAAAADKGSSQYRGVSWHERSSRWEVRKEMDEWEIPWVGKLM